MSQPSLTDMDKLLLLAYVAENGIPKDKTLEIMATNLCFDGDAARCTGAIHEAASKGFLAKLNSGN